MDKIKPKTNRHEAESVHDRRRSTGSFSFSDSETVPNYLRASRGSCHDHCKHGFASEDEQLIKSSRATPGGYLLRKNKSAINSEAALAAVGGRLLRKNKAAINSEAARNSITRVGQATKKETNTGQSEPMNSKIRGDSSSRAQPPRRSFSDVGDPRILRLIEKDQFTDSDGRRGGGLEMSNDIHHTRLVKKHVRVLPERSSKIKRSSSKIPKKPDNNTTKKNRKHCIEHVPDKILHVVQTKAESQVDDIILGSTDSLDSICYSSSDERTCQKEATISELVHSEETSRCMELIDNNTDNQETDLTAEAKKEVTNKKSEDSNSSPRKLRFRRGKEIDVELLDNSTKKLNFGKHGILTENNDCNINVTGVSLRKTETENPQSSPINHTPAVELRGQVIEENNNGSQGSYNTLIKETANKLSRTNSKVKALVGAFESVISLLDTNSQSSKGKSAPIV